MAQATTTTDTKLVYTEVDKGGDWVKPVVKKDGSIVYALQINKSKEDKENIDAILAEYQKAGVEILGYKGKEDKLVLLVDATQKIRRERVAMKTLLLINKLVKEKGFSVDEATDFVTSL